MASVGDRFRYRLGLTKWMKGNPFATSVPELSERVLSPKLYGGRQSYSILLVGRRGCGKSSLLNSFVTIGQGADNSSVAIPADVRDNGAEETVTKSVTRYRVSGAIKVYDMPGYDSNTVFEKMETCIEDIKKILMGEQTAKNEASEEADVTGLDAVIDAVLLMFDAHSPVAETIIVNYYKKIITECHDKGIRVGIVLTKVDAACPDTNKKLTNVMRSLPIGKLVQEIHEKTGVEKKFIFPVQNYKDELMRCKDMDQLLFHCLEVTLKLAIDRDYHLDRESRHRAK